MLQRLKQYLVIAVILAVGYFLLSHHFLFTTSGAFNVLKKNELTLKYTFVSLKSNTPADLLKIDELRDAGIEDVLLEKGLVSETELDRILNQIYRDMDAK